MKQTFENFAAWHSVLTSRWKNRVKTECDTPFPPTVPSFSFSSSLSPSPSPSPFFDFPPSETRKVSGRRRTRLKEEAEEERAQRPILPLPKMPRVKMTYPPKLKAQVLELITKHGLGPVCELFKTRIPKTTIYQWLKCQENGISNERKRGSGRKPQYPELEEKLNVWFVQRRAKQLPVRRKDLQEQARKFAQELNLAESEFKASNGWTKGFEKRHKLSYRQRTRLAFRTTNEMKKNIENYFNALNKQIDMYSPCDIWNYDEVGIYYESNVARTLDNVGARSVSILSVQAHNMRMTVVLMISASGIMAPPVLLYYNKKFQPFILTDYPEVLITSNSRGYNIEETNHSVVLPHFLRYINEGSLLIFDECRGHHSDRIHKLLASHRVSYLNIPGGATCLLQPIDSNIGKIMKKTVSDMYVKWCVDNVDEITNPEGRRTKSFRKPTNQEVGAWVMEGVKKIRPEDIRASFYNTGITSKEKQRFILEEKIKRYYVTKAEPSNPSTPLTKVEAISPSTPITANPATTSALS